MSENSGVWKGRLTDWFFFNKKKNSNQNSPHYTDVYTAGNFDLNSFFLVFFACFLWVFRCLLSWWIFNKKKKLEESTRRKSFFRLKLRITNQNKLKISVLGTIWDCPCVYLCLLFGVFLLQIYAVSIFEWSVRAGHLEESASMGNSRNHRHSSRSQGIAYRCAVEEERGHARAKGLSRAIRWNDGISIGWSVAVGSRWACPRNYDIWTTFWNKSTILIDRSIDWLIILIKGHSSLIWLIACLSDLSISKCLLVFNNTILVSYFFLGWIRHIEKFSFLCLFKSFLVVFSETMAWQRPTVSGVPPTGRSLHTAVVGNNKMYIFGGWIKDENRKAIENQSNDREGLTDMQREWICTNSLGVFDLGTKQPRSKSVLSFVFYVLRIVSTCFFPVVFVQINSTGSRTTTRRKTSRRNREPVTARPWCIIACTFGPDATVTRNRWKLRTADGKIRRLEKNLRFFYWIKIGGNLPENGE